MNFTFIFPRNTLTRYFCQLCNKQRVVFNIIYKNNRLIGNQEEKEISNVGIEIPSFHLMVPDLFLVEKAEGNKKSHNSIKIPGKQNASIILFRWHGC